MTIQLFLVLFPGIAVVPPRDLGRVLIDDAEMLTKRA
jgi:hypothetical protein